MPKVMVGSVTFAAVVAFAALVLSVGLTTIYAPPDQSVCSNKFIDRPMCPGKPRRCGGEIDQQFCPDRDLNPEEIKQLMSVPVDQRPTWNPGWGVPRY